jgi:hypothetical protein
MRKNSDFFLTTWRDQVGAQDLTIDDQRNEYRATKIAKKEQDKGRRCPGWVQKKHFHILFDPNIKAFQGWKAVVDLSSLTTCERFIEYVTFGRHSRLQVMWFTESTMLQT